MTMLETLAPSDETPELPAGENFRAAMRELASGVTIVAAGQGAHRAGCTVTSFASLSLEPPTLFFSLAQNSTTLGAIRSAGCFGASILCAADSALAERFAGRSGVKGAARFELGDWIELLTGAPILRSAIAALDCRVEEILLRHTHAIVIARAVAVQAQPQTPALIHWRRRFQTLP